MIEFYNMNHKKSEGLDPGRVNRKPSLQHQHTFLLNEFQAGKKGKNEIIQQVKVNRV